MQEFLVVWRCLSVSLFDKILPQSVCCSQTRWECQDRKSEGERRPDVLWYKRYRSPGIIDSANAWMSALHLWLYLFIRTRYIHSWATTTHTVRELCGELHHLKHSTLSSKSRNQKQYTWISLTCIVFLGRTPHGFASPYTARKTCCFEAIKMVCWRSFKNAWTRGFYILSHKAVTAHNIAGYALMLPYHQFARSKPSGTQKEKQIAVRHAPVRAS